MSVLTTRYLTFLFTILVCTVSWAQIPEGEYVIERHKAICDHHAAPITLGEDILGLALSAGGGIWYEVDPLDHTNILNSGISNVFLAISRMPGEYAFIFVAKNNPCLPDDAKAFVEITIVKNPFSSNVNIVLCAEESNELDLLKLIPPQLRELSIVFKDEDGLAIPNNKYNIPSDFEGDINLKYTIIEKEYICNTQANLTLVVDREVNDSFLPNIETLSVCKDALPDFIDLYDILGNRIEGQWVIDVNTTSGIIAPSPSDAVIDLRNIQITSLPVSLCYKLIPESSGCYQHYKPIVKVLITDNLSDDFTETSYDVCKSNSPYGFVNLMQILKLDLPVNSGVWSVIEEASFVDVTDGIFEFSDARSGTYMYRYKISDAINLCGIQNKEVKLTLNVYDKIDAYDGEVQLCSEATGSIQLDKYIVGLPENNVDWYKDVNKSIENRSSNIVDISTLKIGTQTFTYEYDAGSCGSASGHLYVTLTGIPTNFKNKTVKYCMSDTGADKIDLDQILAIAGVSGTWTYDLQNSSSDQTKTNNWDEVGHTFNGQRAAESETSSGEGTYVFHFTVDRDYEGCINAGSQVMVKIIITNDLTH